MKKRYLFLVTVLCLIAVVFSGCGQPPAPQETVEVTRGELILSVSVSGNLEMPHQIDLSFDTPGTVKEINCSEGDRVSEGQVLARLDVPSLESTLKMREIDYEVAEINLMRTIYPYYTNIYATDLPGAWLALEEAQSNLEDAMKLLEEGSDDEAGALLQRVDDSLLAARKKSQYRPWAVPFSVKLLELQVNQAEIALDMAEAEIDKASIIAPFSGIIASIGIKEGQNLSTMNYTAPVITLIDPDEIKMDGLIDEIDIAQVHEGLEAIIVLDALPDEDVKGEVSFISPSGTVQMGVVSYKTIISLKNLKGNLKDGMSATAEIVIDRRDDVLLLANRAIRGSWSEPWVEVLSDEGQVEQRQVVLGLSDGRDTELISGLSEGEKVVLPPLSLSFSHFGG